MYKRQVHGARLAPELIDQFVEVVTPIADYSYRWKLNTGCKKSKEERADLMAVSEKPILTLSLIHIFPLVSVNPETADSMYQRA